MKTVIRVATLAAAAVLGLAPSARADEGTGCTSPITRQNVVRCALTASLVVKAQGNELRAASGRRTAASSLLPSNPVLSLTAAKRSIPQSPDAYNWDATLAQELEIAGQRGVRRDAAQAEVDAQASRVLLARREVAVVAWIAFYEALSAREEQRLAVQLTAATQAVSVAARARADKGLIAPVDSDVADAATVRVLQGKLAADRRLGGSDASLVSLLGLDPANGAVTVEGDLVPLSVGEAGVSSASDPQAGNDRPEVAALAAERRAMGLRADAFRRSRIPNPTVSVFVQNDGFNERVLGVGLSVPIPLPGNVGRTYLGEIAEAEALALRASTDRERVLRDVRLAVTTARSAFRSRTAEVEAFTPERITRAEQSLRSLGQEVEAGRINIRDAVVAQQALIELLQANVAARRAWCIASVDLSRAAGMPIERMTP